MSEAAANNLNALVAKVSKVRRWLVVLAILKVAALCLVYVFVYVGVYAWLDNRLHFDTIGRIVAFALLAGGVVYLLYRLAKLLHGHISFSAAANYVESKRSFDQQLVTAIEYYEKKQDYPYSKALAEQLVTEVGQVSEEFGFDSTVSKWKGYIYTAIILFGLGSAVYYIYNNYVYFSSYFARLTQPLAVIEPLPATSLESITGDIVAEPNSVVRFAARIKGRMPQSGRLVLSGSEFAPADSNQGSMSEEAFQLRSSFDEDGQPQFETTRTFKQTGKYKYRFEAGAAFSKWHDVTICSIPKIRNITANVATGQSKYSQVSTEQVKDQTLEVIKDSFVSLSIEATEQLSQVTVTNLDNDSKTIELEDANSFTFSFIADREGFIDFALCSSMGVSNKKMPGLQIMIKVDEPAKLRLVSPDGDYSATNVASVPITFEATDDFGLESAEVCLEIAGGDIDVSTTPVQGGLKTAELTRTLELEDYDLSVGDSILFYAKATDIGTGKTSKRHVSSSDIYFIEIMPYRQRWHQQKPMLPTGAGKQGLKSEGKKLEFLISILEYTRAILKKTWAIANKPELKEQDYSGLASINKDVEYCTEQLELHIKTFDSNHADTLKEIIGYYEQAGRYLTLHKASDAIPPEKNAYRILRKLIIEIEKCLPGGVGTTPKTRDKIKLEPKVHLTRYDKERIEWELKQLAQKLAELAAEQKDLKEAFENLLKQQAEKKRPAQETTDEESWIAKNEKPSECESRGQEETAAAPMPSDITVEGALKPPPKKASTGEGMAVGKGSPATTEEQMKLLAAKQRTLEQEVSQLSETLQELQEAAQQGDGAGKSQEAQEHLDEAMAQMNDFESQLGEAYYQAESDKAKLAQAAKSLDLAEQALELAQEAIESEFPQSDEQKLAKNAAKLAEILADLADEFDESVDSSERERMLARLDEANRLLDMVSPQQMSDMQSPSSSRSKSDQPGAAIAVNNDRPGLGLRGSPGTGRYVGKNLPEAETARLLAKQFWSIAINAKQIESELTEDEPSDARFYELESEFFEGAAKFYKTAEVKQ